MDQIQVVPASAGLPADLDLDGLDLDPDLAGLDLCPGEFGFEKLGATAAATRPPAGGAVQMVFGDVFFGETMGAGAAAGAATGAVAAAAESKVASPPPGSKLPLYSGPLPDNYHDLTDDQVGTIAYKDFVRLMTTSRLNQREVAAAKKRRRRVKNRLSARICSKRQQETTQETQSVNGALVSQITTLQHSCDFYQAQTLQLQERVIQLQKSEADAVRQKLYFEAEVQRLNKLLQMTMSITPGGPGVAVATAAPMPVTAGSPTSSSAAAAAAPAAAAAAAAAGSVMGADEFALDFTAGDFACAA